MQSSEKYAVQTIRRTRMMRGRSMRPIISRVEGGLLRSPLRGFVGFCWLSFQGLTPLAIFCRPAGAFDDYLTSFQGLANRWLRPSTAAPLATGLGPFGAARCAILACRRLERLPQ